MNLNSIYFSKCSTIKFDRLSSDIFYVMTSFNWLNWLNSLTRLNLLNQMNRAKRLKSMTNEIMQWFRFSNTNFLWLWFSFVFIKDDCKLNDDRRRIRKTNFCDDNDDDWKFCFITYRYSNFMITFSKKTSIKSNWLTSSL